LKRSLFFIFCFSFTWFVFAQENKCTQMASFIKEKEKQIERLNLHNPDYIPLHLLVSREIIEALNKFKNEVIPNFIECADFTFSYLINKYDELKNNVEQKHDSLIALNKRVHLLFYQNALVEYQFNNEVDGDYFLQRSLQYNSTFPEAILLKLGRLLDKNRFEECLSLLNTLYYETQLDENQENRAIEFTDNFYDKLYRTGDSLVKAERAAEALELFEILEAFCLNLPTSYCNDDYYHGVLRSKSGILESYLAIAHTAEKRGNKEIAAHFFQYAQEYLEENPHVKNYEYKLEDNYAYKSEDVQAGNAIKAKYGQLVVEALSLCKSEKFAESYTLFLEAKKLEDCKCFPVDFRVDLMLRELSNYLGR